MNPTVQKRVFPGVDNLNMISPKVTIFPIVDKFYTIYNKFDNLTVKVDITCSRLHRLNKQYPLCVRTQRYELFF